MKRRKNDFTTRLKQQVQVRITELQRQLPQKIHHAFATHFPDTQIVVRVTRQTTKALRMSIRGKWLSTREYGTLENPAQPFVGQLKTFLHLGGDRRRGRK